MITTPDILAAPGGIYTIESDGPPEQIVLIVGSCRCVAFLNYINRYNSVTAWRVRPFRIHYVEPFYFSPERREQLETDEYLLSIFRSTTIFIHEHLGNYTLFNTSREAEKNIYRYGMAAPIDVSIPNWNDHFILENDWTCCGLTTPDDYSALGFMAVRKFCTLCQLTSFPEMSEYFASEWTKKRLFWRPNHTSAEFTLWIFRQMNNKFLHLPLDDAFWNGAAQEDLFKEPCTEVTENDRKNYGITW